jgi:hypothetical protein
VYVTVIANGVEIDENNRYRFVVDPYYLVLLGMLVTRMMTFIRRRRGVPGSTS